MQKLNTKQNSFFKNPYLKKACKTHGIGKMRPKQTNKKEIKGNHKTNFFKKKIMQNDKIVEENEGEMIHNCINS